MKKGLLYIFLLAAIQAFSQNPPDPKQMAYDRWRKRCVSFKVKADTFYYSNRVDSSAIECALLSLSETGVYKEWKDFESVGLTDSIVFSQSELAYLKKELKERMHQEWPDHLYEKSYRVKRSDLENMIAATDKSKLSLEQKLCRAVYTFSKPIIIRKGIISIVYLEIDDVMKTDGGIWIYLKKGKQWVRFSALCYQHPINSYRK